MKKYAIAFLTLSLATFAFAGPGQQDPTARLQAAGQVMNEIMAAPDKGIPEEVLNGAKCIAVVPDMAKGGFIVGGEHGRGVVTCRTAHGWSAPAFISIGGGNFGFQAGGQSVDLIMLFMNDKGVQGLLSSKFELTGEASATAGPVGRHASAGTDWKMNTEALSYSRTKGLFVGVAVDGAEIQQDNDSTVAFYGKNVSFRKTLSGDVHAPAASNSFLAAVRAAVRRRTSTKMPKRSKLMIADVPAEMQHAGNRKFAALSDEVLLGKTRLDSAAMVHQTQSGKQNRAHIAAKELLCFSSAGQQQF